MYSPGAAHKSIQTFAFDKKSYLLLIWINLKAALDRNPDNKGEVKKQSLEYKQIPIKVTLYRIESKVCSHSFIRSSFLLTYLDPSPSDSTYLYRDPSYGWASRSSVANNDSTRNHTNTLVGHCTVAVS